MGIKKWSKTASSNDSISSSAGTINWKEGMPPSSVNDSARVTMADVRDWFEDAQWVNLGDADGTTSPRRATNEISLSGTHTATYHVGRRIKALDATGTKYGTITATTFSGGTQITLALDSGSLSSTVSQIFLGALTANNPSIPSRFPFLASNTSTDTNQTGNAASATVQFDTETFDVGNNFASNTFTAPVTGKYLLSSTVQLTNFGAGANTGQVNIVTSNRTYIVKKNPMPTTNLPDSLQLTVVADMDVGDTATVAVSVEGMAGNTVSIFGIASSLPSTFFSGELIT